MSQLDRRKFLKAACLTAGAGFALPLAVEPSAFASEPPKAPPSTSEQVTIIGPKPGYAPQLGTLTSMMAFMRSQVTASTKGMSPADLDFLLDAKANTIGALLMHLAATETFYQLHTFDGLEWGKFPDAVNKKFGDAAELGDAGRKNIKGHDLAFYDAELKATRAKTLAEFKKRDDKWLFAVDEKWPWGPTNNYCKWFHVTEHEANHNGQIKLLKARLPGAKKDSGG